jgi:hypothetical protein
MAGHAADGRRWRSLCELISTCSKHRAFSESAASLVCCRGRCWQWLVHIYTHIYTTSRLYSHVALIYTSTELDSEQVYGLLKPKGLRSFMEIDRLCTLGFHAFGLAGIKTKTAPWAEINLLRSYELRTSKWHSGCSRIRAYLVSYLRSYNISDFSRSNRKTKLSQKKLDTLWRLAANKLTDWVEDALGARSYLSCLDSNAPRNRAIYTLTL